LDKILVKATQYIDARNERHVFHIHTDPYGDGWGVV
jgi:hypothetical protein